MAEHLLDVADVRAAFEHQRGHRVAEEVTAAGLSDTGAPHVAAHEFGHGLAAEAHAIPGQKQRAVIRLDRELRTSVGEVALTPRPARSPIGIMRSFLPLP